jgi:hypothetical protein
MEITLYLFFVSTKIKQEIEPEKLRLIRKQTDFHSIYMMALSVGLTIIGIVLLVAKK